MKKTLFIIVLIISAFFSNAQNDEVDTEILLIRESMLGYRNSTLDSLIVPGDSASQWKFKNVADPIDDLDGVNLRTLSKNTFVGFDNVLIVSQSGNYDATTIAEAMDSIADASVSNTYAIWVMQGIYNVANGETFPITMKDYVTIIGFDDDLVTITGDTPPLLVPAAYKSSIRDVNLICTATTSGHVISSTAASGISSAENKIQNCDITFVTSTSGVTGGLIDIESDGILICQDLNLAYQNSNTGIIPNTSVCRIEGDVKTFFDTNIMNGFSANSEGDVYVLDNNSTETVIQSGSDLSFTMTSSTWDDNLIGFRTNVSNAIVNFSTDVRFNLTGGNSLNGSIYGAYSETGGSSLVDLRLTTFNISNSSIQYFAWAESAGDVINGIFASGTTDNPTGSGIGGNGIIRKTVIENNNFVTNQKFIDENMRLDINSTNQSLNDLFNIIASSGWVSGGEITDNLDGTVDVATGTGLIRTLNDEQAPIKMFDWSETLNIALVDGSANLIYVDYNSGAPIILATTNRSLVYENENNLFELYEIVREGTTLHISDHRQRAKNTVAKIQELLYAIAEIRWTDGLTISGTGTRNVVVTEGQLWIKLNDIDIEALNTSTVDTYDSYYRDGVGGWTKTTGNTQWDNAQYDNGTGTLINYTNGRYGYMDFYIDADGELASMYGQDQYTSEATAVAADEASPLPVRFQEHAVRIGRVTFEELTDIGTFVGYFETQTEGGGVSPTDHNLLSNLNGASPYNHLSSQELANVQVLGTGSLGDLFESDGAGVVTSATKGSIDVGDFNDDNTYFNLGNDDSDDITEGSTNLFSQWEPGYISSVGAIMPKGNKGIEVYDNVPTVKLIDSDNDYIGEISSIDGDLIFTVINPGVNPTSLTIGVGGIEPLGIKDENGSFGTTAQVMGKSATGLDWVDATSGAPIDATYITQLPNATLTNEQSLSSLSTGFMKVTTGTGVISSQSQIDLTSDVTGLLPSANIAGALVSKTYNNVFLTAVGSATQYLNGQGNYTTPPSGGTPAWGDITGTLSDQTDLQSALDAKSDGTDLSFGGTSTNAILQSNTGTNVTFTAGTNITFNPATSSAITINASAGGGLSDPMTTAYDIIYRNGSNTTTRLGKGANGTFLGVSGGVVGYFTPSGGGNVSSSGTPTDGQIALWTNSTTIEGVDNLVYLADEVHSSTSGVATDLNMSLAGSAEIVTMTGNFTLGLWNVNNGQEGTVLMRQDATGSRTLTINTYSDGGTTGLTEIYSGGLENVNPGASTYTAVKYKRLGSIVLIDLVWYL